MIFHLNMLKTSVMFIWLFESVSDLFGKKGVKKDRPPTQGTVFVWVCVCVCVCVFIPVLLIKRLCIAVFVPMK